MIEQSQVFAWRSSASVQITGEMIYKRGGKSMSLEADELRSTCLATYNLLIRDLDHNKYVFNTILQKVNYRNIKEHCSTSEI